MTTYNVYFTYQMPAGPLTIGANSKGITRVCFSECELRGEHTPSRLTNEAANQLLAYFTGRLTVFSVPCDPEGTDFQKQVWKQLQEIPYGESVTARDVAVALSNETAYRNVGSAITKNPIPIIIPSHRVVTQNGETSRQDKIGRLEAALLAGEIRNLEKRSEL